jgi:hypothetical protein
VPPRSFGRSRAHADWLATAPLGLGAERGDRGCAGCGRAGSWPIGLPEIVALIAPENRTSMRVAEKIGMTQVGMVPYREAVLTVYRAEHSSKQGT